MKGTWWVDKACRIDLTSRDRFLEDEESSWQRSIQDPSEREAWFDSPVGLDNREDAQCTIQ